jgi:MinD superfamily P-loop ATPase
MKEIVILSGKGGVGKSSLAAAIGTILAEESRIVLADTDVDAPNLDLVLGAVLESTEDISASEKAFIDYDLCSRCMICVDICRFSAITGDIEPVIINYSCEGCGACSLSCPVDAIEIRPVINGRLNLFSSVGLQVVAGALNIGESSSGRLVDVVKKRARKVAEEYKADLLITDGPPGIGCPVIASLKAADYVLLVTEPTPSALHDLQRIIEVVGHFKTPLGIVINRADIHPETNVLIKQFARENGFDLLAEIPYDPCLPRALSEGNLSIAAYPDAPSSLVIKELAHSVLDLC